MHRSFSFLPSFSLFLLALFLTAVTPAGAQISSATIDFQRQVVTAWGLAGAPWEKTPSLEEERARAWMDAMHHAYEAILSLPLMEQASVRGSVLQNPALRERLGRLLLGLPKTFYEPDATGLHRCRIEVPFAGRDSLRTALYLAALRPTQTEPKALIGSDSAAGKATSDGIREATGTAPLRLILDLRRTTFMPSLFPRFFAEDGRLLFQESMIPATERFSRPMVRFALAIEEATVGVPADRVRYVEAQVTTLGRHDVQIRKADEDLFRRFCRGLISEPLREGEILIVYGNRLLAAGLLPKADRKEKTDGAASAKPKEPAKKGRNK
ncbi:MAG TPA: hypothetical protein PKO06_11625 [Candidatus Ozemobacteraceae bacterium]|nr:hypothetical protein [Candidatus Ozemobacteraceae bacterium]